MSLYGPCPVCRQARFTELRAGTLTLTCPDGHTAAGDEAAIEGKLAAALDEDEPGEFITIRPSPEMRAAILAAAGLPDMLDGGEDSDQA